MNTTIESAAAGQAGIKQPLPNFLAHGFLLALHNWPFVLWAYAVNLVFGLLAGIPFATGLVPYLDHSVAAQRIAGTIDITYLGELAIHLRDTPFFPIAIHTAGWLTLLQVLVLFVFFAGTIFVYVSAEPPRLSVLLRGGVAYFWRFVRAGILVGCVAGLILGILFAARAELLTWASGTYRDTNLLSYTIASWAVVLLTALLLRLWFDLVQVYVVRNAMDGEGRAHRALLPALKLMRRYPFRSIGSFLLIGLAGVSGLALCVFVWKFLLPARQIWAAGLLAQVGLFLLLASRFWQRGLEAALVMSVDPPMIAVEELATMTEEEDIPLVLAPAAPSTASDPTLRDLVAKLRSEPWASPELPAAPVIERPEPAISVTDRHATKFPLGGVIPGKEQTAPSAIEKPKLVEDKEKAPRKGSPLP